LIKSIGLRIIFIAQVFKAISLRKIRPLTLIVWVLGRVEQNLRKRLEKCNNIFVLF